VGGEPRLAAHDSFGSRKLQPYIGGFDVGAEPHGVRLSK